MWVPVTGINRASPGCQPRVPHAAGTRVKYSMNNPVIAAARRIGTVEYRKKKSKTKKR